MVFFLINCNLVFFNHLEQELLTQPFASNDEEYYVNPLPANHDKSIVFVVFSRLNHCYWERNVCLNIKI